MLTKIDEEEESFKIDDENYHGNKNWINVVIYIIKSLFIIY